MYFCTIRSIYAFYTRIDRLLKKLKELGNILKYKNKNRISSAFDYIRTLLEHMVLPSLRLVPTSKQADMYFKIVDQNDVNHGIN